MRRVFFALSLFGLFTAGCAQPCVHQSMLLQENRRLENALYVTHAKLTDLQRENADLRGGHSQEDSSQDTGILPPVFQRKPKKSKEKDKIDNAPPFELPTIEIPEDGGSTVPPAELKSSQSIPAWNPQR
ncbi:MAG: hypothetical protein LBT89_01815 [Planctomycetaceae bacterium]|jgi:hypothetical protein|nr:hypothetical protein [Planctomycetaceae bacterium]